MNIEDVIYFLAVTQHNNNISKAAESLFVSQPTISRRIQFIEEEFGTKLFKRQNNKLTLTDAGELCVKEFEKIIKTYNGLHKKIDAMGKQLSIGIYHCGSESEINNILLTCKQKNPDIIFRQEQSELGVMLKKLYSGDLDMVVSLLASFCAKPSDIECTYLFPGQMYLVVPCDHVLAEKSSVSFSELDGMSLVGLSHNISPASVPLLEKWLSDSGYNVSMYADDGNLDFNSLQTYVVLNDAIGFVVWSFPEGYTGNNNVKVIPIEEHYSGFDFCVAYKKSNRQKIQSFLDCI